MMSRINKASTSPKKVINRLTGEIANKYKNQFKMIINNNLKNNKSNKARNSKKMRDKNKDKKSKKNKENKESNKMKIFKNIYNKISLMKCNSNHNNRKKEK